MKKRFALIFLDLGVNFALGIYYMAYRDTLLGQIMLTCPIAISPGIFIIELICFYVYCRFFIPSGQEYK